MKIQIPTAHPDTDLLLQMLRDKDVIIGDKEQEIAKLKASYQLLLEQFNLAQKKRFAASSEKQDPFQGDLFNEAESTADEMVENEDIIDVSYTRGKPKRKALPENLPREQVIHDIPEAEKTCECCGHELSPMGHDCCEKLVFVPATIKVIEHIRPKYTCHHCEKHGTEANIKQEPVPPSPIPKGIATASLLSQIITSKFQYALPLYRQEMMFKQYGIELSRRTMSDWMLKCATLLMPLYLLLIKTLRSQKVIQADETTLKVVNNHRSKSYMWVYCSGFDSPGIGPPDNPLQQIVIFDYQDGSRSGDCVIKFLDTYNGYLQSDGYAAYDQTKTIQLGCWAHARRKFMDAKAVQPKGKTGKADMALAYIQKLYRLERRLTDGNATVAERYQHRQAEAAQILKEFKVWLDKSLPQISAQCLLGKAIFYTLNQWQKLMRYLDDGLLSIDNNRAERAVKPFVIGRKNWLFNQNARGAEASAVLYSIIETAKANGLIAFDYISHCLDALSHPDCDVKSLAPWKFS